MKIPEELTILGRTYAIVSTDPIHVREGTFGAADYIGGIIYIDSSLEPSLVLNMLWHEAFHIMQQDILGEVHEDQARLVGVFVHSLLMYNPDIIECYLDLLCPEEDGDEE